MLVDFRKTFFPTEVEITCRKQFEERIHKEQLLKREAIKLVKKDERLYSAEPFSGFIGDCEYCSHSHPIGSPSDCCYCDLYDRGGSRGFTCIENDSKEASEWDDFIRIKNENK